MKHALAASIAALLATLAFAATANATTFSALLSGPQAGSDQDQTWIVTPTPGKTTTGVSFDLARGYWPHMHKIAARCSRTQAATTVGCPAASRIAAVAAAATAGSALPVPLTGYIAIERERAGELHGYDLILVLDANGAYRKIVSADEGHVRALDGNPSLRISFTPPTTLTRSNGTAVAARLIALSVLGNDATSGRKRWLRNPTGCTASAGGAGQIRATATYSDGTNDSIAQAPSISGCGTLRQQPVVLFNPKEYTVTKSAGFDLGLTLGDPPNSALRTDPRSLTLRVPGSLDAEAIKALPVCSGPDLAKAACPTATATGTLCTLNGPPRIGACGDVFNMGLVPGPNGTQALELGLTLTNRAGGGGGGGAGGVIWIGRARAFLDAGGVVIVLDGLPQTDPRELKLSVSNPLYEDTSKCGDNPLYQGRVVGWSGATTDATGKYVTPCNPEITLTDPLWADLDGDGRIDRKWLPANFDVPFRVADGGTGIDWSSARCVVRGWNPTTKATVRTADLDGDGRPDSCVVRDAESGEMTLEIGVKEATKGLLSIIRRTATVDASPPVIDFTSPGDADTDGDGYADDTYRARRAKISNHETDGLSGVDETKTTCRAFADRGGIVIALDGAVENGQCTFDDLPEGDVTLEVSATDMVGNSASRTVKVYVDGTAPDTVVEPPQRTATGDIRIDFTLFDKEADPASIEVEYSVDGGEPVACCPASERGPDASRGHLVLIGHDYDDGDHTASFTAIDRAGNRDEQPAVVTFTVDRDPPVVNLTSTGDLDGDGDGYADSRFRAPSFSVDFTVTDADAGVDPSSIECDAVTADGTVAQGTISDVGNGTRRCSFTNLPAGDADVRIVASDWITNTCTIRMKITVSDAPPPTVTIVSPIQGQTLSYGSTPRVQWTATGVAPVVASCVVDNGTVVVAPCPTGSLLPGASTSGSHSLRVTVTDGLGRTASASASYFISSPPPPDVCIAIYPPPPGCPQPPGGGVIITNP